MGIFHQRLAELAGVSLSDEVLEPANHPEDEAERHEMENDGV